MYTLQKIPKTYQPLILPFSISVGLEQKMTSLSQLKVKGLVIGPIHVAPPDEAISLRFEEISPDAGNLDQFKGVISVAHRKGEGTQFSHIDHIYTKHRLNIPN